jgi:outer membrane protein OmpA-like peptidoglycan-associated protein
MHRNFALLALPVLALSILVTTPEPADFQRLLVIKGATSDLIQTSALVGDEGSRASSKAESAFGEKEKEQNATTHNSATAITPSPAAILLSNFESMVATAREEGAVDSKRPSMNLGVLAKVSPQRFAETQRQEVVKSTPIPITFVYNQAALTAEGMRSAQLLLEFLQLKKFSNVALSGHADERGLPNWNMELSSKRLLVIERFLRDGGYQGKLYLLPKGSTEPYMGVDRTRYPYEELMQLDRRVELRTAK